MFINELNMLVSLQEQAEIVKPGDNPLQFDAVNQKNGNGGMIFATELRKISCKLWLLSEAMTPPIFFEYYDHKKAKCKLFLYAN